MNVNLLKDYPDWKWYLLSSGLSLVLTGTLWIASKFLYARPFEFLQGLISLKSLGVDTNQQKIWSIKDGFLTSGASIIVL
jgi:hypothetical protein